MINKTQVLKEWLESGNAITDMGAVELVKSYRLSAIIFELRHRYCMDIRDRWLENTETGTRYKEYYLHKEQ